MQQITLAQAEWYSETGSYWVQTSACTPDAKTSSSLEKNFMNEANLITDELGFWVCVEGSTADYKVKARNEWLRLPENRELFKKYSANIEAINNETTKATVINLEKIKNLGN